MQEAREEADRVNIPTLMLLGAEDRIISLSACQETFGHLTCEKHLVSFEGCYHELHFESVQARVIQETAEWIHAH
jgi:alpha-beta hydrolase superfamily lysophospholipase